MLSNPRSDRVRAVHALTRRAVREREQAFLAEGPQAVREAVAFQPDVVREVYLTPAAAQRHPGIVDDARAAGLRVQTVTDEVLTAMGDTQAPQGMLAVCRRLDVTLDAVLAGDPRLVCVLTHVRDPGNAGTVLRGADAVGADAVVVSEASVDVYNPKVVRSTVGSLFHLPVVVGVPVEEVLGRLRGHGIRLLAADGHGDQLLTAPAVERRLAAPHAWVMGNEAWGMPEETRALCDDVVRVPIHGHAESLNLAMAATVCLYASARALHDDAPH
ncbi:TrmH family RNA methyltransferase [Arsenicicoccus sp. oral taxon 190]|uniref:TrmH family RNA methyltransferase n=1 Tax=Arsenicicoccus sp. oral taxon 190 TaxID=1658671 RepID=UPI00067A30ED|nr:RNA methyltransferase [Arsenicicoccus sp. oral taxon 190]AKT51667.1 RNA methyltransferase [Arsenicicoccus sp. oral taxon 190]